MNPYYGGAGPGYQGQGYNVPHMAPGTYLSEESEDDDDSQMESPTLSDTEWQDDGVGSSNMPHGSFFDDAYPYFEDRSVGPQDSSDSELEDDGDLQMSPQSTFNTNRHAYSDPQMPAQPFCDDEWDDFENDEWKDFVDADVGSHERKDYDYPQMSPQSMLNTNFYDHNDPQLSPSVFLDPEWEDPDYPQLSPPPSGNTEWQHHGVFPAATQRSFNDKFNDDYNPQATPRISLGGRSVGPEHSGNSAGYAGGIPSNDECRLSATQRQDIKVKVAGGMPLDAIAKWSYRGETVCSLRSILVNDGWRIWSAEEDAKVRELRKKGKNWAQISSELRDVSRTEEEVEARAKFLKSLRRQHQYTHQEDEYIRHARAQGVGYSQMIDKRFPGTNPKALEGHARRISATWGRDEDKKLKEMVGDGTEVDWDSIAAEYTCEPPRKGKHVKIRWEYLRKLEQAWKNRK